MADSYAGLNTSKRKFYKLLDNLSASKVPLSASNDISTTSFAEPPNKRSRLLGRDRSGTVPSSSTRPVSSSTRERPRSSIFTVNSSTKTKPTSSVSEKVVASNSPKKTPNYAPWSHDCFLSRLKTFADVRSWTPKPAAIGEVEWAKRGWTVVAKDTVACRGGCEKRILVKIAEPERKSQRLDDNSEEGEDDWWIGDTEKEMVNRYINLIVEGHAEDCLWRKLGCKDDIYRIRMTDPATWQAELRDRYRSLLAIETNLPPRLDIKTQDESSFRIDDLAALIPASVLKRSLSSSGQDAQLTTVDGDANAGDESENQIDNVALVMAITGWSGEIQNHVQLAICSKCFQRVGLWLYRRKSNVSASNNSAEELVFNPIDAHREHCPWKNPTSQCALGRLEGLAGWQVLVSLVKGLRRHDQSPQGDKISRPTSSYSGATDVNDDDSESHGSRADQEKGDKERRGRLQRLRRAFTIKRSKSKG